MCAVCGQLMKSEDGVVERQYANDSTNRRPAMNNAAYLARLRDDYQ